MVCMEKNDELKADIESGGESQTWLDQHPAKEKLGQANNDSVEIR